MNGYYKTWQSITLKIKALTACMNHLYNMKSDTSLGVITAIAEHARECLEDIMSFPKSFQSLMPETVSSLLEKFNKDYSSNTDNIDSSKTPELVGQKLPAVVVKLELLESQVSYLLSDIQVYIRKTVEIAFSHLQRQIVVDRKIRNKNKQKDEKKNNAEEDDYPWNVNKHETVLESLGAAHLLLHKIWALKINAEGQRTDLVLTNFNSIDGIDADPLSKNAEGIILTEWKVIKDVCPAVSFKDKIILAAKRQIDQYTSGALYAIELLDYRYIVLVSEKFLDIEKAEYVDREKNVTYRIINIACDPDNPSKKI